MNESTKKQRLTQIIDYYANGKNVEFARLLGLSPQGISTWLSRNMYDIDLIYAKCDGISAEWLITGKGSMIKSDNDTQLASIVVSDTFPLRTDRHVDMQSVPLYELDATAGLVALFSNSSLYIPVSHIQIPDLPPCDGALYVRGDSMYPILKSGDIVLYKQVNNFHNGILWGEMYMISFSINEEDYLSIKYIQKSEIDNHVRLVSHNGHHSPQDIPTESIRALALIKASVRFNTMG